MKNINQSQVAGNNLSFSKNEINNNKENNNISINEIRKESAIISFIVGFIASLLASAVFDFFMK